MQRDIVNPFQKAVSDAVNATSVTDERSIEQVYCFLQTWPTTALGFSHQIAGQAFTTALTTVLKIADTHRVYFDGRFAYEIKNPTNIFFTELSGNRIRGQDNELSVYGDFNTTSETSSKRSLTEPVSLSLDSSLRNAGMLVTADILKNNGIGVILANQCVNNLDSFREWLYIMRKEFLSMHASMELEERPEDNEMYEWAIAHKACFNEVIANFEGALEDLNEYL